MGQLGQTTATAAHAPSIDQTSLEYKSESSIDFDNAPCVTWIYMDNVSKCDYVCVAVPIISGSQDISFALSENGMALMINYTWPSALFTPMKLFHDELTKIQDPLTLNHPKVHALTLRLLECEITEKSRPKGCITVALPKEVQREIGTWKKCAITSNDTKIIMLEFKAYQKNRIINDADTSIVF